jgi:hypothetical protein
MPPAAKRGGRRAGERRRSSLRSSTAALDLLEDARRPVGGGDVEIDAVRLVGHQVPPRPSKVQLLLEVLLEGLGGDASIASSTAVLPTACGIESERRFLIGMLRSLALAHIDRRRARCAGRAR